VQMKICLIGAGHMGRIHAQKLAQMRDIRFTCVVDADEKQAKETAEKYGIPASTTLSRALKGGLDGAVVASPTETHFPIALELLKNGVHVFLEKPIAATPGEAKELVALAAKRNLVLQVGHLERFNPPFRRALPLICNPLSIEAKRTSAFTGRSTDIDVVYDLMIHDIDLVLSLNRSELRQITARGAKVMTKKIDVATARIEFADGCIATLTASRVSGTRERSLEIVQKDGYISLNFAGSNMLSVLQNGRGGKRRSHRYTASNPDPVNDELRAFVRAMKGKGRETLVTGEDGLRALILADAITELIERRIASERVGAGG
jgi:predicted dehydrogenase